MTWRMSGPVHRWSTRYHWKKLGIFVAPRKRTASIRGWCHRLFDTLGVSVQVSWGLQQTETATAPVFPQSRRDQWTKPALHSSFGKKELLGQWCCWISAVRRTKTDGPLPMLSTKNVFTSHAVSDLLLCPPRVTTFTAFRFWP